MKKLPTHISRDSCRPRIDYPCSWQYKLIGVGREEIRRVVEKSLQEKPFTLAESHVSRRGRYVSMNLELIVENDEERLKLYRVLAESSVIKVVL
jgi:putative lipoic acid-binding regulatory protein